MTALVRYEEACRAIAHALAVDEIMQIRDQAEMMRAAARVAKNRDMEIKAIELRMRGERRLGEIIAAQKRTVGLHRGGRPAEVSKETAAGAPGGLRATLDHIGVTHKLSSRAQKLAAVPTDEFEGLVRTWRDESQALDGRLITDLLKVGAAERGRQERRELQKRLSDQSAELTGTRQFAAVYFDPPWERKQGITDRSYENHYVTMKWGEIVTWAASMRSRLLDDAWGFMWVPRAHLFAPHPVIYEFANGERTPEIPTPLPWAIAVAMGFDGYSTSFDWTKTDEDHVDEAGLGILVRDQSEYLLLFKKGRGNAKPAPREIFGSNHRERSRPLGHSRKPQFYREMIAKMVGHGVPVLECFARHDAAFPLPEGWESWGNEAQPREAAQ